MFDHPHPSRWEYPEGVPAETPDPSLAHLSDRDLEHELCTLAAHVAVAECQSVLLAAEVDRRRIWADQGAKTCAQWLSWRVGLSPVAAREQVRVGRALLALPLTRAAFSKGRLSYSKARALTRIAEPGTEAVLVDMAGYATAAQLEAIVRGFRRGDPEEQKTALARHRRRYLHTFTDSEGMVVISGRLSPEDGAVVVAAIEAARRTLAEDDDVAAGDVPAETPEDLYGAAAADALVAICEGEVPAPRAHVIVHVDAEPLADSSAPGCSYAEGVGSLSIHTVQRLCCDARVSTVRYRPDGTVVPEGKTREIPDRLRRAVFARDGGCRWPGCTARRRIDVHHVQWVSKGGKTRLTNLVSQCKYHHRLIHEGGYGLTMDRHARVNVTAPDGRVLTSLGRLPAADGPGITRQHELIGLALDHSTMPVGGGPMDLAITLDVLFQRRELARTGAGGTMSA